MNKHVCSYVSLLLFQPPKKRSKKRQRKAAVPEDLLDDDRREEILMTFEHALKKGEGMFRLAIGLESMDVLNYATIPQAPFFVAQQLSLFPRQRRAGKLWVSQPNQTKSSRFLVERKL